MKNVTALSKLLFADNDAFLVSCYDHQSGGETLMLARPLNPRRFDDDDDIGDIFAFDFGDAVAWALAQEGQMEVDVLDFMRNSRGWEVEVLDTEMIVGVDIDRRG